MYSGDSTTDRSGDDFPAYELSIPLDTCASYFREVAGVDGRLHHRAEVTPVYDGSYIVRLERLLRGQPYAAVTGTLQSGGAEKTLLRVSHQQNRFVLALLAVLWRNYPRMLQLLVLVIVAILLRQPWQDAADPIRSTINFFLFGYGFFFIAAILGPSLVIAAGEPKRITRYFRDYARQKAADSQQFEQTPVHRR